MSLHHDREQAIREIRSMPEQCFVDGLLLDVPKRRRREQAMNKRPMLIKMAPEHKLRLGTQLNRFIELCGKDLGIELMLRIMERWTNEDIVKVREDDAESNHVLGKDQHVCE